MAQVVIAGCGYVGNALAGMLRKEGHEVYGIRRDVTGLAAGVKGIAGNVANPESLGPAPARVEYAVYVVAADGGSEQAYRQAYLDGLAGFLEWLRDEGQRPRRIVMASSTAVYGQRRGEPIDEDSPTHPTQFRGETLLASEGLLAASGISSVVVRLGGIYGPGRADLIDRIRERALRLRLVEHFTNRIHRDDAAGLIRHLLFHPDPEPLYLGVDDRSEEEGEVLRWLAKELGVEAPREESPEGESGASNRRRAVGSKRCSNRRARESGYRFRYPSFREGYGELVRAIQVG
ncbi:MAG: NAD(P)-dependent oxidoreductase [Deltaproteobacteria bacterium]|nr:NAD(P)-dependent oxidoreductase [Deltaproteobacteria bacterium]